MTKRKEVTKTKRHAPNGAGDQTKLNAKAKAMLDSYMREREQEVRSEALKQLNKNFNDIFGTNKC
jgi:hypothetical protein